MKPENDPVERSMNTKRTLLRRNPGWLSVFLGLQLGLQVALIYQTGSNWMPGLMSGTAFICGILSAPILLYLVWDRVYLEEDIEEEDIRID